jgi:galactokinase
MQCRENHYFSGMEKNIRHQFKQLFASEALLVAAPGRVNLIGEHTDYNQGFVLPGAVDRKIYSALARNGTRSLNLYANQYQQGFSFSLDSLTPIKGWATYLLGMVYFLQQRVSRLEGMDILIDGDVPLGAGMSSSAALCSAFGFGVNELFGLGLSRMELALMGQKTEHQFAGVNCGIMDQFASLHGKAGYLMKLDCLNLQFEYIPFHFPDYRIVLVNTGVSHSLAGTEYNIRRAQCEEGVAILQKHFPSAKSLRDIRVEDLEKFQKELGDTVYRRCLFIVNEIRRVLRACEFLANRDLDSFGQLMFETHEGLSELYEVSCAELDFLVESARSLRGVVGARMMGGGFGGCTINIVQSGWVSEFTHHIQQQYLRKFSRNPEVYCTQIEDGARVIL